MNILLPIITNTLLVLFLVSAVVLERKNGLLAIIKTALFAGSIVGCYFLTPVVLPLLSHLTFITIDINSTIAFSSVLAILCVISLGLISLAILITRKAIKHKKIKVTKPKISKVAVKKVQSKEKSKRDLKLERARNKKLILPKGKKVVAGIFGFITALLLAFVIYLPINQIIKEVVINKPELAYLEDIYKYTPFNQLEKVIDLNKLLGE